MKCLDHVLKSDRYLEIMSGDVETKTVFHRSIPAA